MRRSVVCTLAGLFLGWLLGFGAVFALIASYGMSGSRPFGEMAGVAALAGAMVYGGPGGGLLGALVGWWLGGRRTTKRKPELPGDSNSTA